MEIADVGAVEGADASNGSSVSEDSSMGWSSVASACSSSSSSTSPGSEGGTRVEIDSSLICSKVDTAEEGLVGWPSEDL